MLKATLLIASLAYSNIGLAEQKYYKWTDENGITHYSNEKPEHLKTDEIDVDTNQPQIKVESQQKIEPQESKEKSYLELHREKKQKAKEFAQENKRKCQQAKQTIAKYEKQGRMSRIDEKTGEKIYLDDSKRKKIIQQANKKAKKYCR